MSNNLLNQKLSSIEQTNTAYPDSLGTYPIPVFINPLTFIKTSSSINTGSYQLVLSYTIPYNVGISSIQTVVSQGDGIEYYLQLGGSYGIGSQLEPLTSGFSLDVPANYLILVNQNSTINIYATSTTAGGTIQLIIFGFKV